MLTLPSLSSRAAKGYCCRGFQAKGKLQDSVTAKSANPNVPPKRHDPSGGLRSTHAFANIAIDNLLGTQPVSCITMS